MGFTVLPDFQAKKLKREIKKEKRQKQNKRKEKRQIKRYLKRRGFVNIFASSLLITALIFGCISGGIWYYRVKAAVQQSNQDLEDILDIIKVNMAHSYKSWQERTDLSEEEREEQFKIWMRMYVNTMSDYYPFSDGVGMIYDANGNLFCSTDDSVALVQQHFDMDSEVVDEYQIVWMKAYEAGNELNTEVLEEYNKYCNIPYDGNEYDVRVSSGYIEGDKFYYGKIDFYEPSGMGDGALAKSYDCSPKDTEKMQKIEQFYPEEYTGEYDYYIPILHRKASDSTRMEAIDIYEKNKDDERLSGSSSMGEQGLGKYTRSTFDRIQVADGVEYVLVTAVSYDYMTQNRTFFLYYFVIGIIMVFVISFFDARYRYVRLKAHYDFEDYQKNLTNAMAHDLKSPLMVLSGMAENLKEQVHTEKRDYYAEEIVRVVGDMNHMVEQILGFSKLGSDYKLDKKQSVDMRQLTEELVQGYEVSDSDKHFNIDVEGNIFVDGDVVLLRQMVDNLIKNAIVHGDGGMIYVEMHDKTFIVENAYSGTLTQKDVPRLLTAYEKDDSRKRTGGHGLGLSIVNQIVDLHGGNLSVIIEDKRFRVCIVF